MCGELAFFLVCRLMPRGMVQRHSVQVNMQTPFKHISGEGKGCPEGKCPPYPPTNSSIPKDGKLRVGDLGDDVEVHTILALTSERVLIAVALGSL